MVSDKGGISTPCLRAYIGLSEIYKCVPTGTKTMHVSPGRADVDTLWGAHVEVLRFARISGVFVEMYTHCNAQQHSAVHGNTLQVKFCGLPEYRVAKTHRMA